MAQKGAYATISFPAIFGHEGAGTVIKVGSRVKTVQPGDLVCCSFSWCGSCRACTKGRVVSRTRRTKRAKYNLTALSFQSCCQDMLPRNFAQIRTDGSTGVGVDESGQRLHGSFFGQSTLAKHALVDQSSVVKLPAGADPLLACTLGCGFQTGY